MKQFVNQQRLALAKRDYEISCLDKILGLISDTIANNLHSERDKAYARPFIDREVRSLVIIQNTIKNIIGKNRNTTIDICSDIKMSDKEKIFIADKENTIILNGPPISDFNPDDEITLIGTEVLALVSHILFNRDMIPNDLCDKINEMLDKYGLDRNSFYTILYQFSSETLFDLIAEKFNFINNFVINESEKIAEKYNSFLINHTFESVIKFKKNHTI